MANYNKLQSFINSVNNGCEDDDLEDDWVLWWHSGRMPDEEWKKYKVNKVFY